MRHEQVFEPNEAVGADLSFAASVDVSGRLTPKQIKAFTRARRSEAMGPTAIYYAGLTAPGVSAGMASITYWSLASIDWPQQWAVLASTVLAAMAGISWYLVFMRLGGRTGFGRHGELHSDTRVIIGDAGVDVLRGEVRTLVGWKAVRDITISKRYIALILDGANDVLLPLEWFGAPDIMKAAARKISALRPPPFSE